MGVLISFLSFLSSSCFLFVRKLRNPVMVDVDHENGNALSCWSWEDNKLFEMALAAIDEESPDRWEAVASIVGGKSAEEVARHYEVLLEDLDFIESGRLDYEFGEAINCMQEASWTDEVLEEAFSLPSSRWKLS